MIAAKLAAPMCHHRAAGNQDGLSMAIVCNFLTQSEPNVVVLSTVAEVVVGVIAMPNADPQRRSAIARVVCGRSAGFLARQAATVCSQCAGIILLLMIPSSFRRSDIDA